MQTAYLGVDIGSISTKGVVINQQGDILARDYIWTEGNPIEAVKKMLHTLKRQLPPQTKIVCAGTTGSARRLIGSMLSADVVKNEITAHAVGTLSRHPSVKTIFEIGGQDSKIIIIDDGIVVDYAMNTLCAAGTGSFLSSQAKRLGIDVEQIGEMAVSAKNPSKIAARCTVFAESDLVHKAQIGHKKEDLIAGLCHAVVSNYLNNVGKGKRICAPIMFQGGVSKNIGVIKAFEQETGEEILVDPDAHLMGALGVALLSRSGEPQTFDFGILDESFTTQGAECDRCGNHCEMVCFYRADELLDVWGNRCPNGIDMLRKKQTGCASPAKR